MNIHVGYLYECNEKINTVLSNYADANSVYIFRLDGLGMVWVSNINNLGKQPPPQSGTT